MRCSQTGSKHKGLLPWLCLVNNLLPVKGRAWEGPTPSHKELGACGELPEPPAPLLWHDESFSVRFPPCSHRGARSCCRVGAELLGLCTGSCLSWAYPSPDFQPGRANRPQHSAAQFRTFSSLPRPIPAARLMNTWAGNAVKWLPPATAAAAGKIPADT